jgi:hypothetical protein
METMSASSKYSKEKLEEIPEVKTYEDAANVLRFVHDFESIDDPISMKEQIKEKLVWEAMSAKMKYTVAKEGLTGSRNPGIMKSITPNFYDFVANETTLGRHPDLTSYTKKRDEELDFDEEDLEEGEDDYFKTHPEVPYVESLSGTTCSLIGILLAYLENHKNDQKEDLNNNINSIIKIYIAFYINEGFHSLGEIRAICDQEFVKNKFEEYGVKIDLNYSDNEQKEILDQALPYTKTTCHKKAMHEELVGKSLETSRKPFK